MQAVSESRSGYYNYFDEQSAQNRQRNYFKGVSFPRAQKRQCLCSNKKSNSEHISFAKEHGYEQIKGKLTEDGKIETPGLPMFYEKMGFLFNDEKTNFIMDLISRLKIPKGEI